MKNKITYYKAVFAILFGFIASSFYTQALDPAEMNCVEIDDSGNAFLTWEAPDDPNGEFVSYYLYYSTDNFATPPVLLETIMDYNENFFTHVTNETFDSSICYYVQVNSNDGFPQNSLSSDTICTIHITAEPSTGPLGFADIDITGPFQFADADPDLDYEIYLHYPIGTWTLIDFLDVSENEYLYEVDICEVYYEFRVFLQDENGCYYVSNIAGNDFEDQTTPTTPTMEFLTVDSLTLDIDMEWSGGNLPDTQGYIVYQCLSGGLSVPVDTIFGAENQSYTYETSLGPLTGGVQFTVAAFDFCQDGDNFENISPTDAICHQTIFLQNPTWFQCQDYVDLQWTHYEGWENDGGVLEYEILFKENFGPEQSAGFVSGYENTFTHQNLNAGSFYRYYIKAYDVFGTKTSLSNSQTQALQSDPAPDFTYMLSASVVDDNEINIKVIKDSIPFDHNFILEKREDPTDDWEFVDNQWLDDTPLFEFFDYDVDTRTQSYLYRIIVLNDCGDTTLVSNLGKTMVLDGIENSISLSNTVYWTPYQDWTTGIQEYHIYRSQEEGDLGQLIAVVNGNATSFEDDLGSVDQNDSGLYCYTVEAVENIGNGYPIKGLSFSNQICLQINSQIWIPNAFMVNGINNVFKPVVNAVDSDSYLMKIYSRWGDTIFTSEDPNIGWDGRKNGTLLQEGQYGYFISVKDGRGKLYEQRGSFVMLIAGE